MAATHPHVAIVFSSGMGHFMPVSRFAVKLSTLGCSVTIIIPSPVVSDAESRHFSLLRSSHPHIKLVDLPLLPYSNPSIPDPFFLQWSSIANSAHLLPNLLSSLPPLSALLIDIPVSAGFSSIVASLSLPAYVFIINAAAMVATVVSFSCTDKVKVDAGDHFIVPGLPAPVPRSYVPRFLLDPDYVSNPATAVGRSFSRYAGLLINTFWDIEEECLSALNAGEVLEGLPEVIPVGPLEPYAHFEDGEQYLPWLDSQPDGSVIYVGVGSRTVLPENQMEELTRGLELSGVSHFVVLKTKIIDKEEGVDRKVLEEVASGKGLVVRSWVDQWKVLKHRAIGGFLSHCGWSSVTEAVWEGVPLLVWPQHGDQMINGVAVKHGKVGRWEGWHGVEDRVVKAEEIAKHVKEVMEDKEMKDRARKMKETARRIAGDGGSSRRGLVKLVEEWKKTSPGL